MPKIAENSKVRLVPLPHRSASMETVAPVNQEAPSATGQKCKPVNQIAVVGKPLPIVPITASAGTVSAEAATASLEAHAAQTTNWKSAQKTALPGRSEQPAQQDNSAQMANVLTVPAQRVKSAVKARASKLANVSTGRQQVRAKTMNTVLVACVKYALVHQANAAVTTAMRKFVNPHAPVGMS